MSIDRKVRVEDSVPAFKQAGITGFTGCARQVVQFRVAGDITADDLNNIGYVAPINDVRVLDVILALENTGADASNPLSMEVDVLKNGSYTVLSTKPKLTKEAADGANTGASGTGITEAVLVSTSYIDLDAGDHLEIDCDLTRNAGTVSDEMADLLVQIHLSVPPNNT